MAPEMDRLWPHFAPLWRELRAETDGFLLIGGYGLYLKQSWLLSRTRSRSVPDGDGFASPGENRPSPEDPPRVLVPMDRWQGTEPRVTRDLDLVAALDLIASPGTQHQVDAVLRRNAFEPVAGSERWKFAKQVGVDLRISLDFHAPPPPEGRKDLRSDERRVKPKPSLKDKGIHGRQDAEAVGASLHPFLFEVDGLTVAVPNPVTWAIMKMVAASERRSKSLDPVNALERRLFDEKSAAKHAQDVYRAIAMVTREENDHAPEVLGAIREKPAYVNAVRIWADLFQSEESWGCGIALGQWLPQDFGSIRTLLSGWFSAS